MRKLLNKYTAMFLTALLVFGCDEENGRTEFGGPFFVGLNSGAASVSESSSEFIKIKVNNSGPTLDQDIVVNYSTEGSTAVIGEDLEIVGSGTEGEIVIPAGKNTGEIVLRAIGNLEVDGDKVYNVALTSNNAGLDIGRGEIGTSFALTIIDDDCPIDLVADYEGEWEVVSICAPPGSFNDGFCASAAEGQVVTFTADPSDPLGFTGIFTGGIHDDPMPVIFQTCPGTVYIDGAYALTFLQNGAPAQVSPTDEPETYGTGTFTTSVITVVCTYGNVDGANFDEFVIEYSKL